MRIRLEFQNQWGQPVNIGADSKFRIPSGDVVMIPPGAVRVKVEVEVSNDDRA